MVEYQIPVDDKRTIAFSAEPLDCKTPNDFDKLLSKSETKGTFRFRASPPLSEVAWHHASCVYTESQETAIILQLRASNASPRNVTSLNCF